MRLILFASFLWLSFQASARIDTVWVHSEAMDKEIGTLVIVPDNYQSSQWDYRSVYILHGAGGDYGNWLSRVP